MHGTNALSPPFPSQSNMRSSVTYEKKEDGQWAKVTERSFPASTDTLAPAMLSREDIAGLFTLWNGALATGDPKKVTELYAEDATLLPTVSNQVTLAFGPPG